MLTLAAILLALTAAQPALGQTTSCSLPMIYSDMVMFEDAEYVFRGLAIAGEVGNKYAPAGLPPPGAWINVTYELAESFKGDPPKVGTVWTVAATGSGCSGFPVIVGQEYLFMITPFSETNPKVLGDFSIGVISVLGSQFLMRGPPDDSDPSLATVRALAAGRQQ